MTVGEKIKQIRKEKGMTQKQLGEKLNITQQQIAQYENGKLNPKLDTLERIASALEVSYTAFLNIETHKITEQFLSKNPTVRNTLVDVLNKAFADTFDDRLLNVLNNGTDKDVSNCLNSFIIDIKIDTDSKFMEIYFFIDDNKEELDGAIDKSHPDVNYADELLKTTLLEHYNKLNNTGKEKAIERVGELTEIKKYTDPEEE